MKGSSHSSYTWRKYWNAIAHQLESSSLAPERELQTEDQRENMDGIALAISKDIAARLAKAGRRPTIEKGAKIMLLMKS